MKKRDFKRFLKNHNYHLISDDGPHEKWGNGKRTIPVPRQKELNKMLTRRLMKELVLEDELSIKGF